MIGKIEKLGKKKQGKDFLLNIMRKVCSR